MRHHTSDESSAHNATPGQDPGRRARKALATLALAAAAAVPATALAVTSPVTSLASGHSTDGPPPPRIAQNHNESAGRDRAR